jgi:hypothetical protein
MSPNTIIKLIVIFYLAIAVVVTADVKGLFDIPTEHQKLDTMLFSPDPNGNSITPLKRNWADGKP